MVDDMQGLFAQASEAYAAGKKEGRETFFAHALRRLSELSSEYEKAGNVEAFHAAEMACGTLRSAKIIVDRNQANEPVN